MIIPLPLVDCSWHYSHHHHHSNQEIWCCLPSFKTLLLVLDLFISVLLTASCCKLNSCSSQDETSFISSFADLKFVQGLGFHEHLLYLSHVLSRATVVLLDLLGFQNTNGMQLWVWPVVISQITVVHQKLAHQDWMLLYLWLISYSIRNFLSMIMS